MTTGALKLQNFNTSSGASIVAMTQPLAFVAAQAEDVCASCQSAEAELAAMQTDHAKDVAAQLAQLKPRFDARLEALKTDLDEQLREGLSQCLTALFPALAQASLRQALSETLADSLMETLPETLHVRLAPGLAEIVDVPLGIDVTQNPKLSGHTVEILQRGGTHPP